MYSTPFLDIPALTGAAGTSTAPLVADAELAAFVAAAVERSLPAHARSMQHSLNSPSKLCAAG